MIHRIHRIIEKVIEDNIPNPYKHERAFDFIVGRKTANYLYTRTILINGVMSRCNAGDIIDWIQEYS